METRKKKMAKNGIGRKLLSFILVIAMAITIVRPVPQNGAEAASKTWGGYVYFTVEKLTLGQGCVVEPVKVPVYKKETMEELVQRVLGDMAVFTESSDGGSYLSGIADGGEAQGWTSSNIPAAITSAIDNDDNCSLGCRNDAGTLNEGDYTYSSGWMASLNNESLMAGMSAYAYESGDNQYSDGDVIRLQFSVYNWGQDTNMAWKNPLYDFPDKDRLVRVIADYNYYNSNSNSESLATELTTALAIFNKWDATKSEVDAACEELAALNKQRMIEAATAYTDSAVDYIHSTFDGKTPVYGSEWNIMTLARAGFEDEELYTAYYKSIIDKVKELDSEYIASKVGATPKSTDSARVIIALSSIGADAADIAGYNLVAPLADYDFAVKSGINGAVYSLLALDTKLYDIPDATEGKTQTTREKLVEYILEKQVAAGGWNYSATATEADPDMTSAAICALTPYINKNDDVKAAVEKAVDVIEGMQRYNGAFASYGTLCAESTAQVITALSSCGMIFDKCVTENANLLGGLMVFAKGDGSFSHAIEGSGNAMATQQAAYSLVAYKRAVNGKVGLYDMTDVSSAMYNESQINDYINPMPTVTPEVTTEPTKAPEVTTEPTKAPEATAEPTKAPEATSEPTKAPEATAEPTKAPEATAEPTKAPEATAEPSKAPEATAEPTKAPEVTATPASGKKDSKTVVVNGLKYKLNNNNEAVCTGLSRKSMTKISVPAFVKVKGASYKVTGIAANAFASTKIKSIAIGKNVRLIASKAFYKCTKLRKITINSTKLKVTAANCIKMINRSAVIVCNKNVAKSIKKTIKGINISVK